MLAPKRLPIASLRTHSAAARPPHSSGGDVRRSASRPLNSSAEKSKKEPFSLRICAPPPVPYKVALITASAPALRFHEQADTDGHPIGELEFADRIVFDLVRARPDARRAAGSRWALVTSGKSNSHSARSTRCTPRSIRHPPPESAGSQNQPALRAVGIVEGEVGGEHLAELAVADALADRLHRRRVAVGEVDAEQPVGARARHREPPRLRLRCGRAASGRRRQLPASNAWMHCSA